MARAAKLSAETVTRSEKTAPGDLAPRAAAGPWGGGEGEEEGCPGSLKENKVESKGCRSQQHRTKEDLLGRGAEKAAVVGTLLFLHLSDGSSLHSLQTEGFWSLWSQL